MHISDIKYLFIFQLMNILVELQHWYMHYINIIQRRQGITESVTFPSTINNSEMRRPSMKKLMLLYNNTNNNNIIILL